MTNIFSLFVLLTISLSTNASNIVFADSKNVNSVAPISVPESIISAEVNGKSLLIKTAKSNLNIPLVSEVEAQNALSEIMHADRDFMCLSAKSRTSCESMIVVASFPRHFAVDRTKVFPEYYRAIESSCKTNKDNMFYGSVNARNQVRVFTSGGVRVKSYYTGDVFLFNGAGNAYESVYLEIDNPRRRFIMLEG